MSQPIVSLITVVHLGSDTRSAVASDVLYPLTTQMGHKNKKKASSAESVDQRRLGQVPKVMI
jgi:hypothetical protein